jgi:membrane-bound lytic murein transglycosylase A
LGAPEFRAWGAFNTVPAPCGRMIPASLNPIWARIRTAVILAAVAFGACAPVPPEPDRLVVQPAMFSALAGWADDAQDLAVPALLKSCGRLSQGPARVDNELGRLTGSAEDWRSICAEAATLPAGDGAAARNFFERRFVPVRLLNNERGDGLFTGYYEAELKGARQRSQQFNVPLFRRPPDLVSVELGQFRRSLQGQRIAGRVEGGNLRPYSSRAQIDAGALDNRSLELVWVDSAVDAFFLHVQGSGRVILEDGGVMRVGFDGQNGHEYVTIGRELVARGALARENVTMQSIREWFAANPARAGEIMALNPSYVFFRELPAGGPHDGPIGAMGVALTPGRSLAVDRLHVPLGLPLWLDLAHAEPQDGRVRRLVVAQDTGGAIRGPVRGDLFWGFGQDAAAIAGRMKAQGSYYALVPRSAAGS